MNRRIVNWRVGDYRIVYFGNQPSVSRGRMTGRKTKMDEKVNESPDAACCKAAADAVDGRWHKRVWFEVSQLGRSGTSVGRTIMVDGRGATIVGATICDHVQ